MNLACRQQFESLRRRLAVTGGNGRSRGQALVELALITPLMLILLLAAIDLGRIYYAQISVANAARAGAYEASTSKTATYVAGAACSPSNSVMCAVVNEAKGSAVTVAPADVSMTCTPSCGSTYGNQVSVSVQGHFALFTPLLWVFTGGSNVSFSSTAAADVVFVPGPAGATAPVASFTANPDAGSPPLAVTVVDTSTGGAPTTWSWNFGDGTNFNGKTPPVHTYAAAGIFTITLTVSNSAGTSLATHDITVTVGAPVASFTASPMSGNAPLAVTFTDTSTGTPTTWTWAFGDGQTSSVQSPGVHTYATSGVYTVKLTVSNAGGMSSATKTIDASLTCALPVPNFTFSQQNKNKPVVFVSTSTPTSPPGCAIYYWRWDYGDTKFDAGNLPTSSHDYNQQGTTFQVQLTVTNPAGTVSITKPVTTQ